MHRKIEKNNNKKEEDDEQRRGVSSAEREREREKRWLPDDQDQRTTQNVARFTRLETSLLGSSLPLVCGAFHVHSQHPRH